MKNISILKTVLAITVSAIILAGCTEASEGSNAAADISDDSSQDMDTMVEDGAIASGDDNAESGDEEQTAAQASGDYENHEDGGHAITVDGETVEYNNATVTKTGESEGDEADFYGENSAVYATNGANLSLYNMNINTNGTHANAVFSYGEGTVVNVSNSTIETSGNCSGGIMTTGGGTMNAENLTIHTKGNSSAAIRSDRGGGTVTVNGGNYITDGVGSPAIYSTADITVNNAALTSTASQGVVVEGKNSVTLNNVVLNADNNKHNSSKSDYYEAVMIYQSMSGDADTGLSRFSATGGNIANVNGDIFFVNNTATDITLSGVNITNNGGGVFLRAAAAGWGKEGSNGGKVNLTASSQTIDGDTAVDEISVLNLYLKEGSVFNGAINPDGEKGEVYVELSGGSKWVLAGDSYITSLTCEADSIDLNGYTLIVEGKAYTEGTSSNGNAIEIKISEGNGMGKDMQAPQEGEGMRPPKDGDKQPPRDNKTGTSRDDSRPNPPDGQPPAKPDGEPPAKPDDEKMPGGENPPDKPE